MKGYTSQGEIENLLLTTIDASFSAQVTSWIEQAEAYIDSCTGRNFIADTVASARVFDGNGTKDLIIDDCMSITAITTTDPTETLVAADWVSYPANDTPIRWLRRVDGLLFYTGDQNISITAKWGFSTAVPNDVKMAATRLVGKIVTESMSSGKNITSERLGEYNYKIEKIDELADSLGIKNLLSHYILMSV